MTWYVIAVLILAAAALVIFAARRAMRWAGKRGWVYNTYNPRPPGRGTSGQVASIFQPSIRYVIDEQQAQRTLATQDESGDRPPGWSGPDPDETRPADDLVYVPVGTDRFRAQVIAEACRAEGIQAEILTADDDGTDPYMTLMQRHRLLVHRRDLPAVQGIIDRSGPGS